MPLYCHCKGAGYGSDVEDEQRYTPTNGMLPSGHVSMGGHDGYHHESERIKQQLILHHRDSPTLPYGSTREPAQGTLLLNV